MITGKDIKIINNFFIKLLLIFILACSPEQLPAPPPPVKPPEVVDPDPDEKDKDKENENDENNGENNGENGNTNSEWPKLVRGFMVNEINSQSYYDDIKNWGANVIRLQLHPSRYASQRGRPFKDVWPQYVNVVKEEVIKAQKAGLKVVIDFHQPPFQDNSQGGDAWEQFRNDAFWERPDLTEGFCNAWIDIVTVLLPYKDAIWGYDLYNEPVNNSRSEVPKQWRPLAIEICKAIRTVDNDTWIIFEPSRWGTFEGFKNLEPLPDPKVIYSGHFYDPHSYTHQGINEAASAYNPITYPGNIRGKFWDKNALKDALKDTDDFQKKYNVPIFVGEFSAIKWAPGAAQWLDDAVSLFEERGWSWCYHAFREWQGWSLEHDNEFIPAGTSPNPPVDYVTDRALIIREVLMKN